MGVRIWIVALALWGLLMGCGGGTPRDVVEQALDFQLAQSPSRQDLLGMERLQDQTVMQGVRIAQDQKLAVTSERGEVLPAHYLEGTYTLRVDPEEGRRFFRRQQPFQLTLAEIETDRNQDIWMLVIPAKGTDLSQGWTLVEFIPKTSAESMLDPGISQLSEQIIDPLADHEPMEIPFQRQPYQRFSALDS